MPLALCLALLSAGKSRPARIAMIAMTTSNSTKVNASFLLASWGTNQEISGILPPANAQLFTETSVTSKCLCSESTSLLTSLGRRQDLHTNLRTCLRRAIDPLGCLPKIFLARLVNVAKLLRVAVHEREPRALHLHHDAITAPEGVIRIRQDPFDSGHFSRFKRFGLREAVAEFAPHDFASDQLLIAALLNARSVRSGVWIVAGVNVDQFDH